MEKNIIIENLIDKIKKNILSEGSFDRHILKLSRIIVNQFKKKENFHADYYFERGDDYADFDLNGVFIEDENYDQPFSIHAESDMQTFDIEITYNPKNFPESMNDLVAEIKETVTHEMEHIGQQNFEDMEVNSDDHQGVNLYYLISKQEVPAYVKGLIKRAKTKKMTLNDTMEEWFSENKNNFESPEDDWEIVKTVWMDYARKMLEKEKVKKFK